MTRRQEQACLIHAYGGCQRVFLEARVLSRQSSDEIAAKMGLPLATVEGYVARFYDVAGLLPHKGAVVAQLLRPHNASTDDEVVESFLKRMGYFGGPTVLEACIACVTRLLPGPIVQSLADFSTSTGLEDLKIRRALALELAERDPYGPRVIEHMARHLERKKPESSQLSASPKPATKRPVPTTAEYPPPPRSVRLRRENVA